MSEVLVDVQNVSKKFCRSLKRSLWYGVQDIAGDLLGRGSAGGGILRNGEFRAVNDVSFQLQRGECLGLLGPNGAGKSTLLKMLNGLVKPDFGSITMRGRIGALIELGAGFHPVLTGRENIYVNGAILGLTKRDVSRCLDEIVDFAEIGDAIDAPVRTYSSGMRVRLGFAVATHLRPDVMLVDEVLAVGDLAFRMKCYAHMLRLLDQGTSFILVSHAMNDISRIATQAMVMADNGLVFLGETPKAIGIYEELMARQTAATEEASPADVAGIESAFTVDEAGEPKQEFETGEDILLQVRLKTRHAVVGARLVVALVSASGGVVSSVSTPVSNYRFDLNPPGIMLRLRIPHNPLLVGSYYFNVSLYGADVADFYHRVINVGAFRITGPATNAFGNGWAGLIRLPHEWQSDQQLSAAA